MKISENIKKLKDININFFYEKKLIKKSIPKYTIESQKSIF